MLRSAFAAGFAFAIGMGSVGTAKAGLFDFLFGPRKPAMQAAAPVTAHPDVTIGPARKPKKVRIVRFDPKAQLARTIDPVTNPNWYLDDPTLRKGDILVLPGRVLVFAGGKVGDPLSYVALERTRLLTKSERRKVAAMTRVDPASTLSADAVVPVRRPVKAAELRPRGGARG